MTLHVTNGDAAVAPLRAGGVKGEILCWRDVLHDGPVPAGSWEEVRRARARFIAASGWSDEGEVLRGFTQRDERLLLAASTGEPISLWFEHDLYDQLQLAQVLAMLAQADAGATTLAQAEDYLGTMSPASAAALASGARAVDRAMLEEGANFWRALTSPDPRMLEVFSRARGPLPLMARAMSRLLEEYPAVDNGLSRSERQALEVIARGNCTLAQAFTRSHHEMEPATWMGDSSFVLMLSRLSRGADPLVAYAGGAPIAPVASRDEYSREVVLTDAGHAVLAGDADLVALRGIDRWIGGTHLHGHDVPWRWDAARGRIVAQPSQSS
ncbi:MAG TPA: DUF1835 domain-containing protein [Gemmatimonadales bacterium]